MTVERLNKGWNERLETSLKTKLPEILEQGMLRVESEAKRIVYLGHPDHLNRVTGTLGRSIATESGWDGDDAYAVVGTNVVYAPTHEFGAVIKQNVKQVAAGGLVYSMPMRAIHIPPRPFLTPAFESKKQDAVNHIKESLKSLFRGG